MTEVFLGIGSNVDTEHHIRFALTGLERRFGPVATSRCYANPAVGFAGADFLSLVVRADSTLSPTARHPVTGQPFCEAWALHATADAPWTRARRSVTTPLPEQPGSVVQPRPVAAAE